MRMIMNKDDLTPQEKKALETLPREKVPSAFLEERVVRALRRRGALRAASRRSIEITNMRLMGAVAACLAFVVCGFALGLLATPSQYVSQPAVTPDAGPVPVALSVQEAGSAYVTALERLALMSTSTDGSEAASDEELRQGREAALMTLYTAADEMARIIPRDRLSKCIVNAIETTEQDDTQNDPKVIQF
jgi:hypothetical protein